MWWRRQYRFYEIYVGRLQILVLIWARMVESAVFNDCDNIYYIKGGYSFLESPYFPDYYPAGTACRYKFIAPMDYQIQLNCTIELFKEGRNCTREYFYVANDGDVLLRGAEQLCGKGTLRRRSLFRTLVLAYVSYGSWGRFKCQLQATPQPCDCGWSITPKIVNGKEARIHEYPSIVALRNVNEAISSFCSGSIISHRYVLTSAHCTRLQSNPTNIIIMAGDHNLDSDKETKYAQSYRVEKVIEHPDYRENPLENDIALLYTREDMEWSRGVGPICLPNLVDSYDAIRYQFVDVIGWGTTSFAGPKSATLQKVTLRIMDNDACQDVFKDYSKIFSTQVCTFDATGNYRDSCQYDSGGPVILRRFRQFLVGCISYGSICGADAYAVGVNTRITSYLSWIYQNIGGNICIVPM